MGSHGPPPTSPSADKDLTILVTGFGPFRTHTLNPSYLLATSLPLSLTLPSSSTTTITPSPTTKIKINIIPHPTPLPVSYASTTLSIPHLLRSTYAGVDFVLHIGMAAGRSYYAVERWGRRDGYVLKDVQGKVPVGGTADPGAERDGDGGDDGIGYGGDEDGNGGKRREGERGPEVLGSTVLSGEMVEAWRDGCEGIDVQVSEDAGRYLCDFTYYTSMLQYWKRDREGERPVVFLHVPGATGEVDLVRGRKVVVELIRALVEGRGR